MLSRARCAVSKNVWNWTRPLPTEVSISGHDTLTKTYFEDLGRIVESNAKSVQESTRIVTDYWIASRERNNKVAQEITRILTEGMKHQTEANEDLTSRIFEILEERDEAHKRFFKQWAEAFSSVPFEYTHQATREAHKKTASLK